MTSTELPKTLSRAVNLCLFSLMRSEKEALKNTLEENLIAFHLSLAKNIREQFGLWEGNDELIKVCESNNYIERLYEQRGKSERILPHLLRCERDNIAGYNDFLSLKNLTIITYAMSYMHNAHQHQKHYLPA
jgi:hypothetical protein